MIENSDKSKLISMERVCFWRGTKEVLHDINLEVEKGDFIAITGPNGGGKTTLLRIILKLLQPQAGRIEYYKEGKVTDKLSIGYLPQKNMIDSHFPMSVRDVISSGLLNTAISPGEKKERIEDMIHLMELETKTESSIGELSGGQLQRVLLGRALVSSPHVLILDEPLSYLDKRFESKLYNILSDIASMTTIILVSHEMSEIAAISNRHIIVDHTLHICQSGSHLVHYDCDHEDH